jgi:hypothetical protein
MRREQPHAQKKIMRRVGGYVLFDLFALLTLPCPATRNEVEEPWRGLLPTFSPLWVLIGSPKKCSCWLSALSSDCCSDDFSPSFSGLFPFLVSLPAYHVRVFASVAFSRYPGFLVCPTGFQPMSFPRTHPSLLCLR